MFSYIFKEFPRKVGVLHETGCLGNSALCIYVGTAFEVSRTW